LLAGLASFASFTRSQVPPEKVLTTFTVSQGLEIRLWASEPLFVNPTSMDIDHKGRVWVCESINYRHTLQGKKPRRPEGDRILILEDTTGSGKADKVTVFYQSPQILAPLGVAVAPDPDGPGCKVFVCQSPDILVFEDKDGDGKADGPPKKLLTGFRGVDHDHGVHGIFVGPDGKLYFSVGDQGVQNLQSSDGKGRKWTSNNTDCQAGTIWRCDLDGKNLELLAHNFRNQYEPCLDSFGTLFVSDNDDDGNQQTRICYVMPGGNYGYHPRGKGESHWHEEQPGVVPKILRTYFGSPTGMCVYEGSLLPKKYHGQLLHTDAGPRHARCYHLTPKGASYAVDREDMVQSTDNWFRPSDICVAPDGSVYIADWYDPGVGGHGMGDTTRGRIFRLAPTGNKPAVPKVDLKTQEGLLDALASPNLAVRYMATAKLAQMDRNQALQALTKAATQKDNGWLRARALWQLGKMDNLKLVRAAYFDDDPNFRILAMRILHDFQKHTPADYTAEWQQRLVKDPSAQVRREALLLLRQADPAKAKALILQLAKTYDGEDRFFLAAVGIAVSQFEKTRRELILADFEKEFPKWNAQVAGLVWELRPPRILPLLEKQLLDAALPVDQRKQIVDIIAGSGESGAGVMLLKSLLAEKAQPIRDGILEHLQANLAGKWSNLKKEQQLGKVIDHLLAKTSTQPAALVLIGAGEQIAYLDQVVQLARDGKALSQTRLAAIDALARLKSPQATDALLELATDAKADPSLALAAVLSLGQQNTKKAQDTLESLAGNTQKYTMAQRQAAVAGLAKSRQGTIWLLEAYGKDKLAQDLKGDLTRLLHNSPFPDLRNKALQLLPAPGKLDPKNLPSIAALLAKQGNAKKGKVLLLASMNNQTQCLKCHTIRGIGGEVGPDLSVIGKKASRENLLESILYPSRAIADQYVTWIVESKQGVVVTGLLIEDSPKQLVVRDANGQDHMFKQSSVASKTKSPTSIMPDNLILYMTETELIDMVDYLYTLKSPGLMPPLWNIIGPFPNGKGDTGMKTAFPPEKEINFTAKYKGKDGDVQWQKLKVNSKGYVDLRAWLKNEADDTLSYAHCEIDSPMAQKASILLGTDDAARLWINGKLVYSNDLHRAAIPEQDQVQVNLKQGRNTLLLKISNGDGDHGFYLSIVSEQPVSLAKN
jgi:putative membrane-bound dehydrogenase-like protein